MRKGEIFALVFSAMMNFLFFLVIHKNASYQYLIGSNLLVFFVMMKLSFGGFALGLLLRRVFSKRKGSFPGRQVLFGILAYMSLAIFLALNVFGTLSRLQGHSIYVVAFLCAFVPSVLWGIVYSTLVLKERGVDRLLLSLLFGSVLAVVIYNYVLVYLPFSSIYSAFFLVLIFASVGGIGKMRGALMFFSQALPALALIFLLAQTPFLPGEYRLEQRYEGKERLNRSFFGPYGILDVVVFDNAPGYHMFSDKMSPSPIAVKGDMENVQIQAIVPYFVREYEKSLIIGAGGGQDIVAGLHYNTSQITAVEIDAQRVKIMTEDFSGYTKGLFLDPKVEVVVKGAREFLRGNRGKYDLIVIQRPWTNKVTNSFFYDASGELFTEEALKSYFGALNSRGVLYFGLPYNGEEMRPFSSIRKILPEVRERMAILYPYEDERVVSVIIGDGEEVSLFAEKYRSEYRFIHYPGKEASLGENKIIDCIFFGRNGCDRVRTDRQFYGAFDKREMDFRLFVSVSILLVLVLSGLALGSGRAASYLAIGAGYETVSIVFAILFALFLSNFMKTVPVILTLFMALGGIGYALSGKFGRGLAVFSCALVASALFVLVLTREQSGLPALALTGALFLLTSAIITVPFGRMLWSEKGGIDGAFALDYLGSLLSIGIIFYLPNLDYLLVFLAATYLALGGLFIFSRGS